MSLKIKNIVIADDDQEDVDLFQSAVDETCSKLSLTVAMDGTKLMKLLDNTPAPDAIFLDLNMLGKSGKDCLEEIRSQAKFDEVPVMILSTSNRKSEIDHCLNNGADHYFVKPNNYDELKNIIMELCNGKLTIAAGASFHLLKKQS
jgi:DNA-binding response OmpR family regulator